MPTVPLDPPTAYGLAALLVVLGRRLVEAGRGARAFRAALAFSIFFALSVQPFLFRWPDWMYAYLVPAEDFPPQRAAVPFFLAVAGAGAMGAWVALQLLRAGRARWALAHALGGIALWLAIWAATWDAYFHVGTRAEWLAGLAPPLAEVPDFRTAMNLAGAAQGAVGIGLAAWVLLAGRRAARLARIQPDPAPDWRRVLGPVAKVQSGAAVRVARARAAQAAWAALPVRVRARALRRLRRRFLAAADEFVAILEEENGRPAAESWIAEIVPNADLFDHWARRGPALLQAEPVPIDPLTFPGKSAVVERLPRGVVGLITPWNFPVALPLRTIVPALLAGNAIAWKPSEHAARSAARLHAILAAELPPDLVALVEGGPEAGRALIDAGVDHLVFVGSTAAGRAVAEAAGRALTSVSLELGGKDAALVLHDADLERTADGVIWAAFANAGQNCAAIERCYVDARVAAPFAELLRTRIAALRQGEDVGPITTAAQHARVRAQLAEAGVEPQGGGRFVRPVLLVDPPADLSLLDEETFGPVLPLFSCATEEEMVRRANAAPFGLTASVWSRDRARAEAIGRRLQAGVVTINAHAFTGALPQVPWSGVRASGFGVTNGDRALDALTRPRLVLVDRGNVRRELFWYPYDASQVQLGRAMARLRAGRIGAIPALVRAFVAARRRAVPATPARWGDGAVQPRLRPIEGGAGRARARPAEVERQAIDGGDR